MSLATGKVRQMNFRAITLQELPPVQRAVSADPTVHIHGNGQLSFNKSACAGFDACEKAQVLFDDSTRTLVFQGIKEGSKVKIPVGAYIVSLKRNEKIKMITFSATQLLRALEYDYRSSDNQSFNAAVDTKNNTVAIDLPKGALTPKPKAPRKKKSTVATAPTVAASASAGAGSVSDLQTL